MFAASTQAFGLSQIGAIDLRVVLQFAWSLDTGALQRALTSNARALRSVREAVEPKPTSDDGGIRAEFAFPYLVRQDHHRVAPRHALLVGVESASHLRLDAEHTKEVATHQKSHLEPWLCSGIIGKADADQVIGHQAVKRSGFVTKVDEVRIREAAEASGRRARYHHDDMRRIRHRQGPQEQGVGEAEDGRVGADAKGEREDGDRGEP
jgi:hypothetical protein